MFLKIRWYSTALATLLLAGCTGSLTTQDVGKGGGEDWFGDASSATSLSPFMADVLAFGQSPIVVQKSCVSCHTIGETGGTVGPILNQLFNRRSEEWLRRWLKNPNDVKPGTKMPNFEFTPPEVDELLSYMRKLRKNIPTDEILGSSGTLPEKGARLVEAYDCLACHRLGNEGRFVGVDLTWVGLRKSEDWERHWLKEPAAWKPETFMPNFRLTDGETEAIAAYLHTMQGQQNEASRRWETRTLFFLGGSGKVAGEMVFNRLGCWGCHGQQGKLADKNPNAAPNGMVPPLWGVKNRLSEAKIRQTVREGSTPGLLDASQPAPPFACPTYGDGINAREMDNLVTYINSLAPKERVWKFQ
ncbi:MAG: cytochrome c [Candidatus Marinimicrobia bacterium]|nr:cytochrome c [Candidatus Neomarinimicrobiota bacterium]